MSILIKGMEMPDSCYQCILYDNRQAVCIKARRTYMNTSNSPSYRPDWCPLVEVPTPHGRLIDADALLSVAEPIEDRRGNVKRVVWDAHINRRPTVIEAEE